LEREVRELYRVHATPLQRYAGALSRTPEGAPDAVQEVFLRYFIERSCGRPIENPRAWLYRVLRNYLLDTRKSAESIHEVAAGDIDYLPGPQEDPEAIFHRSQTARHLLAMLSPRERETLALRHQGLSYDEIAEVLGLRSGTVGALLARAYRKFREGAAEEPDGFSLRTAEAIRNLLLQGS
jgi:RNA polymerase sigma-70 factor (ECF subfamily)